MTAITFAGKVVLITGSSSGIGAATSELFAKLQASLVLTGRNEQALNAVAERCRKLSNGKVHVVVGDLTKEQDVEKVVQDGLKDFGRLDVLVNAAGILYFGSIETTSLQQYDSVVDTNVRSLYYLTKLCISYLEKTKGCIVNVSSVGGTRSFAGVVAYNMSKAAVDQFTRCTALELAPKQIRVNAVNPGVIITDLQSRAGIEAAAYEKYLERCKETHALGRVGLASEVAEAITFLASDNASFITAATLPVDGVDANARTGDPLFRSRLETVFSDFQRASEDDSELPLTALSLLLPCTAQLQQGPQCGLVALRMAATILRTADPIPPVSTLFEIANEKGYSNHGEFYSAYDLASLAEVTLSCKAEVTDLSAVTREVGLQTILSCLLKGRPVLVPYDCDKNHVPMLANGAQAHWAVLVGCLLLAAKSASKSLEDLCVNSGLQDETFENLFHLDPVSFRLQTDPVDLKALISECELYVYALHGKSKHVCIWKARELLDSNGNVGEIGEKRKLEGLSYVVPKGGLKENLMNKLIILSS